MTTLVLVGNAKQPFHRLLDAVKNAVHALPKPVIVQHGNTPFHDAACQAHAFLDRDRLAEIVTASRLIICHAGAGCVIDALNAGHIPVIMPRKKALGELIDDHQCEFAQVLQEAGKALVIESASDLVEAARRASPYPPATRIDRGELPMVAILRKELEAISARRGR